MTLIIDMECPNCKASFRISVSRTEVLLHYCHGCSKYILYVQDKHAIVDPEHIHELLKDVRLEVSGIIVSEDLSTRSISCGESIQSLIETLERGGNLA